MAMGRLDELRVGELAVRDLTIAIMDLEAIRGRLGGELGGVLGFDVFGRGRLEIDYPARRLRLETPEEMAADERLIVGDRIASSRWGFTLAHPGAGWTLVERPPLPHTKLLARHVSGAELELVVAEAHGLGLEQVRLSVEASLPLQVESFRLVASTRVSSGGRDWLSHLYDGTEAGTSWRYLTRSTATRESIVTASACAPLTDWPVLEAALVALLDSVVLSED
jgi:hypothetical protein